MFLLGGDSDLLRTTRGGRDGSGVAKLTLVAGQGHMGGGEHMLLRIGEAAQSLGSQVSVIGPSWGDLGQACTVRDFTYSACRGSNRRTYALSATYHLARTGLGLVWANGAFPALLATATPNPLVVHLHQQPSRSQDLAVRGAVSRSRAVLVPSRAMCDGVAGSQVLLNWTEDLPLPFRVPGSDAFTVAYLGRLSVDKGVDTLVSAVNELAREEPQRNVRLLVAGDSRFVPEESASLVRHALRGCEAEVVQLGWTEPARALAAAHVAVVPSRWAEPFGLVAAEAMAMGCPLVVSDAGALPEVVGGNYPWMFPAGDAMALKEVLQKVGGSDVGPIVDAMRQRWEELFSPPAGRERLEAVLRSVI